MKNKSIYTLLAIFLGILLFVSCSNDDSKTENVTINFKAKVGTQDFACNATFTGLGSGSSTATVSDFRLYLHDVVLVEANGTEAKVTLTEDNKWQKGDVVLLDFENKTGSCLNGTSETNTSIIGTVASGNYTSIKFKVGVPFDMNHQEPQNAASPLNLTSLFWVWNAGYKFVRIDLQVGQAGSTEEWRIHLGSTGCNGAVPTDVPTSCANTNRSQIMLSNFNASSDTVIADLSKLVASSNIGSSIAPDPGCMSKPTDADCAEVFNNLGLPFSGNASTGQTFFSVE